MSKGKGLVQVNSQACRSILAGDDSKLVAMPTFLTESQVPLSDLKVGSTLSHLSTGNNCYYNCVCVCWGAGKVYAAIV